MDSKVISSFLTSCLEDINCFAETFGTSKLYDKNFMLIADALSEELELFEEVIKEQSDVALMKKSLQEKLMNVANN